MKTILHFILFFSFLSIQAQQSAIDSLSIVFHSTKQDSIKARLLAEIGIASYRKDFNLAKSMNDSLISFSKNRSQRFLAQGYRMKGTYAMLEGDYEGSLVEYDKALSIIQKLGRKDIEADYLSNYATLYNYKGEESKSREYYHKSIELNKELGRDLENVTSYINLAMAYRGDNNYTSSIEYLINALSLSEGSDKKYRLEYIHSELAKNYMLLIQYEKADFHLNKGLAIALKNNDVGALGSIYTSLGYLSETRDDSPILALEHYEKSLSYNLKMGGNGDIANAYYNVGLQNIKLNKIDLAESQTKEGLTRAQAMNDKGKEIYGELQLADIYIQKKQIEKANTLISKADAKLKNGSSIYSRQQYFRIGKSFESIGSYKEGMKYIEKYTILSDSLYQKNGLEKIAKVEEQYESKKKENEILRLENENISQQFSNQEQQSKLRLLGLGMVVLILGLAIFYYYYRKNKKQKEVVESLQRELHHRVKNNLAVMDSFISLAKKDVNNEKIEGKLSELQNRVESINAIHEQLYLTDDITKLNIKEYTNRLSKSIQDSFNNQNITIKNNVGSNLYLNSDKAFSLGLIINEFLINSFKHGFNNMNRGLIDIDVKTDSNKYHINLSDNGIGLPEDLVIDDLATFGLDIMKISSEQLKGNFAITSNNGVTVSITFPKY